MVAATTDMQDSLLLFFVIFPFSVFLSYNSVMKNRVCFSTINDLGHGVFHFYVLLRVTIVVEFGVYQ